MVISDYVAGGSCLKNGSCWRLPVEFYSSCIAILNQLKVKTKIFNIKYLTLSTNKITNQINNSFSISNSYSPDYIRTLKMKIICIRISHFTEDCFCEYEGCYWIHYTRTLPNSSKTVYSTCTATTEHVFCNIQNFKQILDRLSLFAVLSRRLNTAIL